MTYPPGPPSGGQAPAHQQYCAFHPDRLTALACTRCGRPACAEDLTPASVGFQCPACIQEGRATQRVARTHAGSRVNEQPIVTYVLIGINVLIFAICAWQAGNVVEVNTSWLNAHGSLMPAMVGQGEYWRVITSGFLHGGLIHVALNMMSLALLGLPLERMLGRVRFLVVYLLALLGGSVSVMWFEAEVSFTVGASGAIFGLIGALIVAFRRMRADPRQLVFLLAINLFITFQVDGISWQGHLGGLVVGAAAGAIMVYPPAEKRRFWQIWGSVGLAVVLIAAIAVRAPQVDRWECELRSDSVYCLRTPTS